MSQAHFLLAFLVLLGGVASVLRLVSSRAPLVPYPVVLAAAGLLLGLVPGLNVPKLSPDLVLLAFVPGLVFEAALTVDPVEMWRRGLAIGLLATVGVAMTVLLVAAGAHFVLGLSWPAGFLLGAIVAATDPIAVVSIIRRVGAPAGVSAILEGESLLNDGTGIAVFAAVAASIATGAPNAADAGARLVLLLAGGIAAGVAFGLAGGLLMRLSDEAEVAILATLVVVYGAYLCADFVGASGIVAVVTAGIVLARFGDRAGHLHDRPVTGFWNLAAFALNAVLFVLIGVEVPGGRLLALLPLALGAWVLVFIVRAAPVYSLLWGRAIPWRWRHMVFFSGLRGGLGVALALVAEATPGVDPRVPPIAYGVVLLSLFIQGGLALPVARRLRLAG